MEWLIIVVVELVELEVVVELVEVELLMVVEVDLDVVVEELELVVVELVEVDCVVELLVVVEEVEVDLDVLWQVVQSDLPPLISELKKILKTNEIEVRGRLKKADKEREKFLKTKKEQNLSLDAKEENLKKKIINQFRERIFMADITAQLVKELREKTGAGMGDCKNALVESNGDIKEAIEK